MKQGLSWKLKYVFLYAPMVESSLSRASTKGCKMQHRPHSPAVHSTEGNALESKPKSAWSPWAQSFASLCESQVCKTPKQKVSKNWQVSYSNNDLFKAVRTNARMQFILSISVSIQPLFTHLAEMTITKTIISRFPKPGSKLAPLLAGWLQQ